MKNKQDNMPFDEFGYFKDYYVAGKYIGSRVCEKDREVCGYYGRKKETLPDDIVLDNKRKIKAGTEVITELQILCGKMISNIHEKHRL